MLLRLTPYCLCLLSLLCTANAYAKEVIKVGGYPFSPYVNKSADGQYSGLTLDILAQLNQIQDKYHFTFVSTSSMYRYQAFSRNRFELMLFENRMWGWQHIDFYTLPIPLDDGEIYIAQNKDQRDQHFFDDITDKKLILVDGYHYNITQDITDKTLLNKKYDVTFVNSNHASIEAILRGRGDVAPVTWSYLQFYLKNNPDAAQKLLTSIRWDQRYQHQVLLSHQAAITEDELMDYLQQLDKNGTLDQLAQTYNLTRKITYR